MKKLFFMALVAVSMVFASCSKMSPEAQKAWENVKEKAAAVCSMEAVDQFESVEDYQAASQAFSAAVLEMQNYQLEYSKEITDSLETLSNQFSETAQQFAAYVQQMQEQAAEAAEEAVEEVVEEVVE